MLARETAFGEAAIQLIHKHRDRIERLLLTLGLLVVLEWVGSMAFVLIQTDIEKAFYIDFVAFWAGGKLLLAGEPMAVWDQEAFIAAQNTIGSDGRQMPWFYPPSFHLAVAPFGLVPFIVAYAVMVAGSLAIFVLAVRRIAPRALVWLLVSPMILITLRLGNNSLIFAGCLMLALESLRHAPRAGLLIAFLSSKPGLGLLIPVALAAGRHWRVFLWAAAGTITFAVLGTAATGVDHWFAFFEGLDRALSRVGPEAQETQRMISWYPLLRYLDVAPGPAMTLHLGLLGLGALALIFLWRRGASDWAAAALLTGVSLTSPHAFHYEVVFALGAFAFAWRSGLGPVGFGLLGLLWLMPLQMLLGFQVVPIVLLGAPLLTACFIYFTWRGLSARG